MKNYLHLSFKFTLLILLISMSSGLFAQNGDCSCVNCPQPVQDNGTFGAILNVNIDGPNDLSLCNLEQVCFQINHTWIGDFSVSLQAPDGTEYMLMGDNDNNNNSGCGNTQDNLDVCIDLGTTNPLTNNAPYACNGGNPCLTGNWTVPCGITAPTTTGVFPVGFGLVSNPQVAPNCDLNDFNTPGSPASGQWVLFTHDYCSADVGTILDFSLEFSCPTLFCGDCSADAGIINQPNVEGCFGSPDLNLNINPIYVPANSAPDPSEYSYTYAVSTPSGTITQFIMGPNLSTVPPGTYSVCGVSYLTTDAGTLNSYIGQTLTNLEDGIANGLICADISDNCFDLTVGPPLPPIIVMETLCAGDCYTDPNGGQCCWPVPQCSYFTPTGTGCDQETIVQFTWTPPVMTQDEEFVCEGDCVIIDGMSYCAPGPHLLNLMTFDGCDSLVTLLVTEVPIDAVINPANPEISCAIPTVVLDGSPSTADTYEWTNPSNVNIGNGPMVTVGDPGTYTLEVTVTSNGVTCTDTEMVTVVETSTLPQMPDITGLLIACDGDVFTYTTPADPEATDYIWTIPVDATIVFGGNGSNQATIDWSGSNGGQVCVEVTNDCGSGGQDCINVVVNSLPAQPDITGDSDVCFEGMGSYCVTLDPDATSYSWTVPNGAIILTGQGSDCITVDMNTATSGSICVNSVNDCGNSLQDCFPITFGPFPADVTVSGDDLVCPGDAVIYTATVNPNADTYIWTIPACATILSGTGTNEITVLWETACTAAGDICVYAQNSCGDGMEDCLPVMFDASPPLPNILGPDTACENDIDNYTIITDPNIVSIVWEITGGTLNNGQGTDAVNVTWGEQGIGTVCVTVAANCGASDQACLFVEINALPTTPDIIGPDSGCTDSQLVFSLATPLATGENVSWTTDCGDIIAGAGTDEITVEIGNGTNCEICATTSTNCGFSQEICLPFTITSTPATPIIMGDTEFCGCVTSTYTTALDPSATNIVWTVPADATILSGQGTGEIAVDWCGSAGGDVCVEFGSSCGIASGCLTVVVGGIPTADFTVDTPICIDDSSTITYTGSAVASATYVWDFAGGTIVSGSGEGPYEIEWATAGTYTVSLIIDQGGCMSLPFTEEVVVQNTLTPPVVSCNADITSVTFDWADVIDADSYMVNVLFGNTGTMTGNTYTVDGLMAGDSIAIEVIAISGNSCPDVSTIASCVAQNCPVIDITMPTIADICIDATTMLIDLDATLDGDNAMGSEVWTGDGITDMSTGMFDPTLAMLGANTILYEYTEGTCIYNSSLVINVNATPTADFTATNLICIENTSTITYTGTASSAATYTWDFDGGFIISGANEGPYEIEWGDAGTYEVSLTVEENGCTSTIQTQMVQVDEELIVPTISCNTGTDFIEFTWPDVIGASGYDVTVVQGASGTLNGNSYLVNGLMPGDTVAITLEVQTMSACGNVTTSTFCIANDCPTIDFFIAPVADICLNDNPGEITLAWTSNDPVNGEVTWVGSCITDPFQGTFDPMLANLGANEVTLTYVEGDCNYSESIFINVFDAPTANFGVMAPICESETSMIVYLGNGNNSDTYTWDFDGGNVVSGSGDGPYEIQWDAPGDYTVSLVITSTDGCISNEFTEIVQVDPMLIAPVIQCSAETNQVEFFWNPVANASSYDVLVLSGQTGMMTSDTSFLVTGLMVNDMVDIQVTVNSDNACPNIFSTGNCQALDCPDITVDVDEVADICLEAFTTVFNMNVNVVGSDGSGSGVWAGNGIIDENTGTFDPSVAGAGPVNITYTFTEVGCEYIAQTDFMIFATPTSDFTVDQVICEDNTSTITYTGSATSSATYNWDFDGGTILSGSGDGPYEIQWPSMGTYTVSLMVAEDGCMSGISEQTVQVDELLIAPIIDCESTVSTIEFSWDAVANATGYTINVLSGPTGTQNTATSYLIENLAPGQSVTIEVIANSANACPSVSDQTTCEALNCPTVTLTIDPIGPFCFDNLAQQVPIAFEVDGGDVTDITWDGVQIVGGIPAFNANQQPGTYDIIMNYQDGQCTESISTQVVVNALPIADAGADQLLTCVVLEVPIGGNSSTGAGIEYLWESANGDFMGNPMTLNQSITTSGIYTLTVTDTSTGCIASDEVTVNIDDDMPELDFTLSPIDCFGDDNGGIFINGATGGTPPYLYSFNGSAFTSNTNYTGLMPGPYMIQVQDSNGCESEEVNVTVNQPNELNVEIITFIEGNTIIFGDSIEMELMATVPNDSIVTIEWTPAVFLSCDTCVQTIAQPLESATFTVAIEDVNGCRDTDELQILVEKVRPVYIPNAFSPDGLNDNDIFMIYAGPQVSKVKSFLVYNRWGETVHQYYNFLPNDPAYGWNGRHKGQIMNPGVFVYWAEIEFIDGTTEIYKGDVTLMR